MTAAGKTYGDALYVLAAEENLQQAISGQLGEVLQIFAENPSYTKLLDLPNITKQARTKALDEAFGGQLQPYLLNFLKILCEKGAVHILPECAAQYTARYNADRGIVVATAITAVPLTDAQHAALQQKLASITNKTITLHNRVSADCLGGVRLEMTGVQLDGTVQNRLEELRRRLSTTV